jgi:hypothetical protein
MNEDWLFSTLRSNIHAVDDDEGSVSDTESGSDFRGEVDVSGRVNQVDKESISVDGLLNISEILSRQFVVKCDGCGLDGNATLLLVLHKKNLVKEKSCERRKKKEKVT